jgi:hypothetical protein
VISERSAIFYDSVVVWSTNQTSTNIIRFLDSQISNKTLNYSAKDVLVLGHGYARSASFINSATNTVEIYALGPDDIDSIGDPVY